MIIYFRAVLDWDPGNAFSGRFFALGLLECVL